MHRLQRSFSERQAVRHVLATDAYTLQRAMSAPPLVTAPLLSLAGSRGLSYLGLTLAVGGGRESVSADAEVWYLAPPVSRRFRDQGVVQPLLARRRQTLGGFRPSAVPQQFASRKRPRDEEDIRGTYYWGV